jgi:hypothetical protein
MNDWCWQLSLAGEGVGHARLLVYMRPGVEQYFVERLRAQGFRLRKHGRGSVRADQAASVAKLVASLTNFETVRVAAEQYGAAWKGTGRGKRASESVERRRHALAGLMAAWHKALGERAP